MGLFKINAQVVVEGLNASGEGPIYGLRVHRAFPELDETRTYTIAGHTSLKSAAASGYISFCDAGRALLGTWFDSYGVSTKQIWYAGYKAL